MKRFRPGLRTWILVLYIFVSIGGLLLLNSFTQMKQNQFKSLIGKMDVLNSLQNIRNLSEEDSGKIQTAIETFSQSKSVIQLYVNESSLYSGIILLGIIVVSTIIFICVLSKISKPLRELQNATEQIRKGDFSVHLPETGLYEMKMLKSSFNMMSHELESIQKRLLVAEKEMIWKDLSRILAHEIKNPLTPIQLAVQRIEEKMTDEEVDIRQYLPETLNIIQQEIDNLRLLAQDFSSFAKVTQANHSTIDPTQSIEEICKSYTADFNIRLKLDSDHRIRFDKTHFYQIITNILQNAIDASDPESPIDITLKREKSFVVISIKDYGVGIPPEDMTRIFEPYFTKKNKGTGLGLALVKKLCDANGAVIRVKSKPATGSEFVLIIDEERS